MRCRRPPGTWPGTRRQWVTPPRPPGSSRAGQPVRRMAREVVPDRAGVRRDHDPVRRGGRRRPRVQHLCSTSSSDADAGRPARETLQQTRHAQPAIFAVEMGLARLWQSWGLEPDVVPRSQRRAVRQPASPGCSAWDGAWLLAERTSVRRSAGRWSDGGDLRRPGPRRTLTHLA